MEKNWHQSEFFFFNLSSKKSQFSFSFLCFFPWKVSSQNHSKNSFKTILLHIDKVWVLSTQVRMEPFLRLNDFLVFWVSHIFNFFQVLFYILYIECFAFLTSPKTLHVLLNNFSVILVLLPHINYYFKYYYYY